MNIRFFAAILFIAFFTAPNAGADVFTFKADRMTGSKALGREITILSGNAEVRSDNMLLRAERIEIQGDDNQFIDCIGSVSYLAPQRASALPRFLFVVLYHYDVVFGRFGAVVYSCQYA